MIVETASLPTHVALVARRLNVVGLDSSGDTFLIASYLAEIAIKTITVALHAALSQKNADQAYRIGHTLVRADGLGNWDEAITLMTNTSLSSFLPPEFGKLTTWATQKRTKPEDEWFRLALDNGYSVLDKLGLDDSDISRPKTIRGLISLLVRIRNKTKAHGAVGPDFFAATNTPYVNTIADFIRYCPVFSWEWRHLTIRQDESIWGVQLRSEGPQRLLDTESAKYPPKLIGVNFVPDGASQVYGCGDLLQSNRECSAFWLPNGGFNDTRNEAEFIDYASGSTTRKKLDGYSIYPVPLPPSETAGLGGIAIQSNVIGNLPQMPTDYVQRRALEEELHERILDRNHAIITLHGRGGIGKTFLALFMAHQLANEANSPFEYIIWFSARDLDLRLGGPVPVKPAVIDLKAVSKAYSSLLGGEGSEEDFAKVLQSPTAKTNKGVLFIFDNFETMAGVVEMHRFLDTFTYLPNKVLITSRERAFKADFPIEVKGMEPSEAEQMLRQAGRELYIEPLLTDEVIKSIYSYTEGHAYLMRVLVGEMAKERRFVPPKQALTQRLDIVSAVFERSFNKLSNAGRRVFLAVSSWDSSITELSLIVILAQRGIDVEAGIEECTRLSLISRGELSDGQPCYSAPQIAKIFGKKKLASDPDRLLIHEDLDILRKFGVLSVRQMDTSTQDDQIIQFIGWCMSQAISTSADEVARIDSILEAVAELWPRGWQKLAQFRIKCGSDRGAIEYAHRRAVEEMPFNKEAWLERARYAEIVNDEATRISSIVSAVEADPSDVMLVREAALQLCKYIDSHKFEIPKVRRGIYLASVRDHMKHLADNNKLDANGLSRLAWLFLLEENLSMAWLYADAGKQKDPMNTHCLNILQKLETQGYWSQ